MVPARLLAHHSDEHNPHIVSALDKLSAGLPDLTVSSHLKLVADVVRERPLRAAYIRTLEVLTRAWADKRMVLLRYRDASGKTTERTLAPYFLEVSRSEPASYVIGFDRLRNTLRTFKIERIETAELLEERYTIPEDFNPYHYLANSWGVIDDASVEVHLRFNPTAAPRVRESVWHHSQRLQECADGGCELLMTVGGIREIRSWVLGWGADVEVLAPTELRDEVASHVQRLTALYHP
ncbi:MAG: WYL domain-containing protein [Chloroflexaceae bacterium]|nr:WYL domain-containing protein [Chloroflexaceae bacterium]